jgi:hypothetical protein
LWRNLKLVDARVENYAASRGQLVKHRLRAVGALQLQMSVIDDDSWIGWWLVAENAPKDDSHNESNEKAKFHWRRAKWPNM